MIVTQEITALQQLVDRSRRLGADRSICNWGGGNTSAKTTMLDHMGREIRVMWVKGSGSDLAEATEKSFTALRLDEVLPLMERDAMTDEEMVDYLAHCMVEAKHPRSSIETLLHAFIPHTHVDHTHPDSIIAICTSTNGREVAKEIFGDRAVWVPYLRPGFALSKLVAEAVRANPQCECVLMEKHGLITWGETSEACYANTVRIIGEAAEYLEAKQRGRVAFGGVKHPALPQEERRRIAVQILPFVRGIVSERQGAILSFDDSPEFLEFAGSHDAPSLSQVGAACPDHLVHTKRRPLFVDWSPSEGVDALKEKLKAGLTAYRDDYTAYYERNVDLDVPMHDPFPRILLIPGLGVIGTGKNKKMANIALDLYRRAIEVMRGATAIGEFVSLDEKESFDVEYWPLELYKLTLAPPEKELSRKVAYITGGAGGIGSATARRLAEEGAHVVIADLAADAARRLAEELCADHGPGTAIGVALDVTQEDAVVRSIEEAILAYGGIDLFVSNAGLASSAPVTETSLAEWNKNVAVLGTGYFLTSREAFRVMVEQGRGGAVVFVTSKNAVYAGKDASAYSAAKAMENHLARCLAVEGGPHGIRVNIVMPDAVLQGSNIWNSAWREERARAYGIAPEELEDYYRRRTILGVNILPEDIAEAILFFCSPRSAKTTGCMLTVDGGVAAAFPR
ncbi:bifunctional rhamnulose-1-phosphate aldolase/short-chain dehydrogenase [Alicyclobacillus acidocaldarius]|uniref:Rhamnulose-1-phosphate aldolase/alcohol dehydrogenase n=1 Tax=Alicyclobacillus acidocaldarius subsp. acidocaldarius (strain ATCC 27009 / DSM 446 / BCRC 14685 / JCM 5260 / KCTC 1825 / NBRC 15652 / NCIMB 11725 / NRRL B-14509 / 104-IA) TaxID=521098 RepID=C8WTK8_ALIAD|nr:bifunctional rhamnulose-1-phosphate aldolase/short-chain dehydrogenase [Alicyclobacillus acidocaldarius]ACV57750.1 rhamnulose-1-phosphate aldolase/alcohol dehydrogenase [Alicyclobacillus acidocaldarius subsp. acidocaldarius DSM 446]